VKSRQNITERMLEIEKTPRTYLSTLTHTSHSHSQEIDPKNYSAGFERFLTDLLLADVPVAFRLQSLSGGVRLDYTTPRFESGLSAVESAFRARFPPMALIAAVAVILMSIAVIVVLYARRRS
jgi:hypothetical protein